MDPSPVQERLQYARVLVELGELDEAEREIADTLDDDPDDLTTLNLLSKIKHMKGELSQAIACWAQLHARSPHNELALMGLSALLQMAKDPARGAGEYVALGQFQSTRRPAAHVELESAFGLLLAGRVEEARATCDRIAAKYKPRDRDAYKLAVMAKGWIAELTGDFELACRVLEGLGNERGFEQDADRALSLARIYERIGSRERLEKAVYIFRYLDRSFVKMSAQSRLASLYRKLGDEPQAKEYERRFTESFQRRMHRVSLAGVAGVASEHFLPIERLREIRAVHFDDERVPLGGRPSAIAHAIEGDVTLARAEFEQSAGLLDRKYLANLAALEGDPRGGTALRRGRGRRGGRSARARLAPRRDRSRCARGRARALPPPRRLRAHAGLPRIGAPPDAPARRAVARPGGAPEARRRGRGGRARPRSGRGARGGGAPGRELDRSRPRGGGLRLRRKGQGAHPPDLGRSTARAARARRLPPHRGHPRKCDARDAAGDAQHVLRRPRVRPLPLSAPDGRRAGLRLHVQGGKLD